MQCDLMEIHNQHQPTKLEEIPRSLPRVNDELQQVGRSR